MVETNKINEVPSPDVGRHLFLACWPDQSLQELLYDLARHVQLNYGGRRTESKNIHLTLLFLGHVHREKEQQLRQRLRLLDLKQFDLELDQAGSFTHCRINWVGPKILPRGLKELHMVLKRLSQELNIHSKQESFRPHISLLRDCHSENKHDLKPMPWKVDKFCLIESRRKRDGVEYKTIEEFQLSEG